MQLGECGWTDGGAVVVTRGPSLQVACRLWPLRPPLTMPLTGCLLQEVMAGAPS